MKLKVNILLTALVLIVAGCATADRMEGPRGLATLDGKSGSDAFGIVTFTEMADGTVTIRADLSNVPPGVHGFHVHEVGDCSAPDASSAGGHFNPGDNPHGSPTDAQHHAGDLGNVTASSDGRVEAEMTTTDLTVSQGPRSVVGKAVVLHADADDLESQPSGAAGARIACGVVNLSPES
ncbi:MAG: superoxide dismutase family protein [Thermoanaerobaculia bacterium]|nr:superoxide dismutase family protein [Thermoanaerobaculia bacterium]